jgi:hypothetical protein
MGVVDKTRVITAPGNLDCPFSPPFAFKGTGSEYVTYIRSQFVHDLYIRQSVESFVRFYKRHPEMVSFSGPFMNEAKDILVKLAQVSSKHQSLVNKSAAVPA